MSTPVDCVVVAGGRSSRFGPEDKALVPVGGVPMLRRVVDRLRPVAGDVIVNCRPDQHGAFAAVLDDTVRFALDDPTDAGPAMGLATALADRSAPAFVVGCDYPLVDPRLARALRDHLGAGVDAVVPRVDGRPQTLYAVYRPDPTREACRTVGTDGSLRAVLDRLPVDRVDPLELVDTRVETFHDVDTPADRDRVERLLDGPADPLAAREG